MKHGDPGAVPCEGGGDGAPETAGAADHYGDVRV
jgi:hypothetical protein